MQIQAMVAQAVGQGANLICLPELSILPGGESERFFSEIARAHGITVVGSLNEKTPVGGADECPVFDIGPLRMATPTCYDQWFPKLARIYSMNGAQFIFYPTAIGSEPTNPDMDSRDQWQTIMWPCDCQWGGCSPARRIAWGRKTS